MASFARGRSPAAVWSVDDASTFTAQKEWTDKLLAFVAADNVNQDGWPDGWPAELHAALLEMFNEAIDRTVLDNIDYVPPFGSGGAMYLRPFLFGHGAKLGLGPAPECAAALPASP